MKFTQIIRLNETHGKASPSPLPNQSPMVLGHDSQRGMCQIRHVVGERFCIYQLLPGLSIGSVSLGTVLRRD